MAQTPNEEFRRARDFLLAHRSDHPVASRDCRWPKLDRFNWAVDHFDPMAEGNHTPELRIVEEDGSEEQISFEEMSVRSKQGASWLRELGVRNVTLLDPDGYPADEGEICLPLEPRPVGLMVGYHDDDTLTAEVMRDGYYHTGDVARREDDGQLVYVGRADDVFKSSDYRISPFELESILIEHDAVAEAAVVPSPDPVRTSVPKAFIALREGADATAETARSIFAYTRQRLAPYKRIRCIEFIELPKTISGKIRRVELRGLEVERRESGARVEGEFWEK